MKKHLSSVANSLLKRSARLLSTSLDDLVDEFELGLEPEVENYARKLIEFCSSRALNRLCQNIESEISNGSFSRFTFDMMVAWETPSSIDEQRQMKKDNEGIAKEKEDLMDPLVAKGGAVDDDVSLFYSDIMPLLVDDERCAGDDAFVWLASLLPLVADVVNARFTFEALSAHTANRLYYPAYDRFLKEIFSCITYLEKQSRPTGVELAYDEFILHVEGTARTQRVVRHIGATSWPGRLTLTNKALYFEASGVVSYENALKIDLSNVEVNHQVSAASTGPWGAPLFDKALAYESSEGSEPIILEFPEMTSSIRRDLWLALLKEVIFLHQFLVNFNIGSTLQEWEMQARTILGIIRLHGAREMLRISPPVPRNFLIFTLFDELPKGDYVLEELSNSLKHIKEKHPCSATSILNSLNISDPYLSTQEVKEGYEIQSTMQPDNLESLETTISQVREETKEVVKAKATIEGVKEEGIAYSLLVLVELLSPLTNVISWFKGILTWEKPTVTVLALVVVLAIIYKEWIGYTFASLLLSGVGTMLKARLWKAGKEPAEIVVSTATDQTMTESIVSAHHSLNDLHSMVQAANIVILKIQSILASRAPRHAVVVMWAMAGVALFLSVIPFRFVLMALTTYCFIVNRKASGKKKSEDRGDRRVREWWNSIPVTPVRVASNGT